MSASPEGVEGPDATEQNGGHLVTRDELRARLVARTAPVVAGVASATLGGPHWLTATFVTAGAILVGSVVSSAARGSGSERALVTAGLALSIAVILGLVLAVLPAGLTTRSWVLGLALLELLAIAATRHLPLPAVGRPWLKLVSVRGLGWYVAGVAVLSGSLIWSVAATLSADAAPPALSLVSHDGAATTVAVSTGRRTGPMSVTESAAGVERTLRTGLVVEPGHPILIPLDDQHGLVSVQLHNGGLAGSPEIAEITVRVE